MINKKLRTHILSKNDGRCAYCYIKLSETVATVDHIRPRSMGGEDTEANLVPACKSCNSSKNYKSLEAWQEYVALKKQKNIQWEEYLKTVTNFPKKPTNTDRARLLGRYGGQKTKQRYGNEHFKKMVRTREEKRRQVLASVTVGEIQNPVTLKSVQEKLEQIDNEN